MALVVKNPPVNARRHKRTGFDLWVRKILRRRKWHPLQDSCLKNPHGQRNLAGYSPCGHKESDTTERARTHTLVSFMILIEQCPHLLTLIFFPQKSSGQFGRRACSLDLSVSWMCCLTSEKAMAPHSSTSAWKTHGRRSLVGCSPWGR